MPAVTKYRTMTGRYLMVLRAAGFRSEPGTFEMEAAFAEHLRLLRKSLGPLARELIVAAPEISPERRAALEGQVAKIDEEKEGIYFHPMYPSELGHREFFMRLPRMFAALYEEVQKADVVHAGNSPLFRPFEFPALMLATALGKKTISVTDIDHRESARMNLASGTWSRKNYLVTRLLHDPFMHLQQMVGVRRCSLVLLKGQSLAEDYGKGRNNVKYFLDSAFSVDHIIPQHRLEKKLAALLAPESELRLTYFGRLVPYKGVDYMLRALRRALDKGARVRLDIIGAGPAEASLKQQARELELEAHVDFVGPIPFGPALFDRLYDLHVLLAAPLREDTPRSALDAAAAGQVIIAFDTYYYRERARTSPLVDLVPWRDGDALGDRIVALDKQRQELAQRIRECVAFAHDNTQELWLERRAEWTRNLFSNGNGHSSFPELLNFDRREQDQLR